MHICVGNLTSIGSDNGLSSGRRQSIIWTNAGILLIRPLGKNWIQVLIKIHTFSFKKMYLKMLSGKWQPFCLGFYMLSAVSQCSWLHLCCAMPCHQPNCCMISSFDDLRAGIQYMRSNKTPVNTDLHYTHLICVIHVSQYMQINIPPGLEAKAIRIRTWGGWYQANFPCSIIFSRRTLAIVHDRRCHSSAVGTPIKCESNRYFRRIKNFPDG